MFLRLFKVPQNNRGKRSLDVSKLRNNPAKQSFALHPAHDQGKQPRETIPRPRQVTKQSIKRISCLQQIAKQSNKTIHQNNLSPLAQASYLFSNTFAPRDHTNNQSNISSFFSRTKNNQDLAYILFKLHGVIKNNQACFWIVFRFFHSTQNNQARRSIVWWVKKNSLKCRKTICF